MTCLVISCSFPTGWYEAATDTTRHAQPEWPPHPIRIFSALVAGAGVLERRGQQDAAKEAREALKELESAAPPSVDVPEHVGMYKGVGIYPPGQAQREPSVITTREELDNIRALQTRSPRPAVLLPYGATVSFRYTDRPDAKELAAKLRPAAMHVTYLGRPTGPVLVSATTEVTCRPPDQGTVRWVRTEAGDHALRCPMSGTLEYLDTRHDAYVSSFGVEQGHVIGEIVRYSSRPSVRSSLATRDLWFGVLRASRDKSTRRLDSRIRQDHLPSSIVELSRLYTVVPVFHAIGPYADNRWIGTLILHNGPVTQDDEQQSIEWHSSIDDLPFGNARATTIAVCSASDRWTTLVPLIVDKDEPYASAAKKIEEATDATCTAIDLHLAPRHGNLATPFAWPGRARPVHATFQLERPVQGPVAIDGFAIYPDTEQSEGKNA